LTQHSKLISRNGKKCPAKERPLGGGQKGGRDTEQRTPVEKGEIVHKFSGCETKKHEKQGVTFWRKTHQKKQHDIERTPRRQYLATGGNRGGAAEMRVRNQKKIRDERWWDEH